MKARAHVQPAIVYFGAHHKRTCLDVWSAYGYAAIIDTIMRRRLSTKCFILNYIAALES